MADENIITELHCVFCNAPQSACDRLVQSGYKPLVYICDNCVYTCADMLDDLRETEEDARNTPIGRRIYEPSTGWCAAGPEILQLAQSGYDVHLVPYRRDSRAPHYMIEKLSPTRYFEK